MVRIIGFLYLFVEVLRMVRIIGFLYGSRLFPIPFGADHHLFNLTPPSFSWVIKVSPDISERYGFDSVLNRRTHLKGVRSRSDPSGAAVGCSRGFAKRRIRTFAEKSSKEEFEHLVERFTNNLMIYRSL